MNVPQIRASSMLHAQTSFEDTTVVVQMDIMEIVVKRVTEISQVTTKRYDTWHDTHITLTMRDL